MVPYYGDFAANATVYIPINTFDSNDPAASVTVTNLVNTDVHIHKDGGTTQRNNAAGITMTVDYDSITGNHLLIIDTSDNTVADFFQAGHEYQVRVEGITVDSGTINAWVGSFSIERAGGALALIKSATYGLSALKTLLDTTGIKVASFANNAITANAINADAITNAKIADDAIAVENIKDAAITAAKIASDAIELAKIKDGAISAAKFAANAITSTVIADDAITAAKLNTGAITADAFAADAIVAATLATGAITADAFAANAITNAAVADDVDVNVKTMTAGVITAAVIADGAIDAATFAAGAIDAAAIAAGAIDAATLAADMDAELRTIIWNAPTADYGGAGTYGQAVEDILADTNELQVDDYPTSIAAIKTVVDVIQADTDLLDDAAGGLADIHTDVAAVKTVVDAVQAKTDLLTFEAVTNHIEAAVQNIAADAINETAIKNDAITAAKIAAAAIDQATFAADVYVVANVKKINNTTLTGDGGATPWGPA